MRQFRTKEYLKDVVRTLKLAERRVQAAKDELDRVRRFWRSETDEYWKEQRAIKARRKSKEVKGPKE